MAAGAIALVGAVEERQATQFRRFETQLAGEEGVVLGIERSEVGVELLVLRERERHGQDGALLVVEDVLAEDLAELAGVRRCRKPCDQIGGCRVGHFVRREQWTHRLHQQILRAAIAIEAPGRRPLGVEAEAGHEADVLQRRNGPKAWHVQVGAARLHGEVVALRVRVPGIVAGRTRHRTGRGKSRVGEDLFTECYGIRAGLVGCAGEHRRT